MATLAEIAEQSVYEAALSAANDAIRGEKRSPRENAAAALDAAMQVAKTATVAANAAAGDAVENMI